MELLVSYTCAYYKVILINLSLMAFYAQTKQDCMVSNYAFSGILMVFGMEPLLDRIQETTNQAKTYTYASRVNFHCDNA